MEKSEALQRLMAIAGESLSEDDGGVFSCPAAEGNFPSPSSCSVYYQCAQGTPHRRQCDAGLYWSVDTDMCDWIENVTC